MAEGDEDWSDHWGHGDQQNQKHFPRDTGDVGPHGVRTGQDSLYQTREIQEEMHVLHRAR